jgi:hypothetical protein
MSMPLDTPAAVMIRFVEVFDDPLWRWAAPWASSSG